MISFRGVIFLEQERHADLHPRLNGLAMQRGELYVVARYLRIGFRDQEAAAFNNRLGIFGPFGARSTDGVSKVAGAEFHSSNRLAASASARVR